jgi:hypothetical protein
MVHASSKVTASPFLLAAGGPTNTFSLTGVAKLSRAPLLSNPLAKL